MTRATLLATTAAILLPLAGAFAKSTESEAGVTAETSGAVSAQGDATAEGSTETGPVEEMTDSATSAAGEVVDQTGDVGTTMAPDAEVAAEADATADTGTITVGELTGTTVIDASGADIGEVDMVVAQGDGTAVVIGVGGFLGIGEYHVAIPVADLTMSAEGELQLSGYTEEDLRALPEFEEDGAHILASEDAVPELG